MEYKQWRSFKKNLMSSLVKNYNILMMNIYSNDVKNKKNDNDELLELFLLKRCGWGVVAARRPEPWPEGQGGIHRPLPCLQSRDKQVSDSKQNASEVPIIFKGNLDLQRFMVSISR